jgi:hypothetical protein
MMNRLHACLCAFLLAVFALSLTTSSTEKPNNINLYKGTVNGNVFHELTLDKVTDIFGRPSQHILEEQSEYESILYSEFGLLFNFDKSSKKCSRLIIFISEKISDKSFGLHTRVLSNYKKYNGNISKDIDENWKLKNIFEQFKDNNPVQQEKKFVRIDFKNHYILFISAGAEFIDIVSMVDIKVKQQ